MKTIIGFLILATAVLPGIAMAQHDHGNERRRYENDGRGYYDYSTRRYYSYEYGGHSHLERMASQLWNAANAVCWEAHNNYRHERGYAETYREMYKMLKDSEHLKRLIHDEEHHPTSGITDHIATDLHELDKLMHHVQDDVRRWHRDAFHHDDYHSDHNHGVDRVYGQGDIKEKLFRLEYTVHHLMKDYGVKSRVRTAPEPNGGSGGPPPPPGGGLGNAPPQPGGVLDNSPPQFP